MLTKRMFAKYAGMSAAFRKIAKYLEGNLIDMTYSSVAVLSEKCGASKATIVRFAYMLGYEGYNDMQKAACLELFGVKDEKPPENRLDLDRIKLRGICADLMASQNVLITGYLDSFGTASEMVHVLDSLRPGVFFSRHIQSWTDMHNHMSKDTTAIFISFAPHYVYTIQTAKEARERNCRVISLTDSPITPINRYSDIITDFELSKDQVTGLYDTQPVLSYIRDMAREINTSYPDKVAAHRNSEYMKHKNQLWEE